MSRRPAGPARLGLLLVGFAFKISAVPFHMWTPDAYQGAPTLVTGFMSTGVKAAAFAAFVRVFLSALEPFCGPSWVPVVSVHRRGDDDPRHGRRRGAEQPEAHARLLEHRARRLPAGRPGRGQPVGKAAILFYLLAYAVTNLGAFGVIALLGARDRANDDLRDFAGLWHERPALAALMTVFLLSLGGLPPTVGFIGEVVHLQRRGQRRLLRRWRSSACSPASSRCSSTCASSCMMYMADASGAGRRPRASRASAWRRWRRRSS